MVINHRGYPLHRLVMQEVLGRPLRPTEHVHHVDGNRQNNQPANLRLMTPAAHNIEHKRKYPLVLWCPQCGRPILNLAFKRGRTTRCCSKSCGGYWRVRTRRARLAGRPAPRPAPKLPIPEAPPPRPA